MFDGSCSAVMQLLPSSRSRVAPYRYRTSALFVNFLRLRISGLTQCSACSCAIPVALTTHDLSTMSDKNVPTPTKADEWTGPKANKFDKYATLATASWCA
jgi:hypothetical protein